jgi:hypothetical protein
MMVIVGLDMGKKKNKESCPLTRFRKVYGNYNSESILKACEKGDFKMLLDIVTSEELEGMPKGYVLMSIPKFDKERIYYDFINNFQDSDSPYLREACVKALYEYLDTENSKEVDSFKLKITNIRYNSKDFPGVVKRIDSIFKWLGSSEDQDKLELAKDTIRYLLKYIVEKDEEHHDYSKSSVDNHQLYSEVEKERISTFLMNNRKFNTTTRDLFRSLYQDHYVDLNFVTLEKIFGNLDSFRSNLKKKSLLVRGCDYSDKEDSLRIQTTFDNLERKLREHHGIKFSFKSICMEEVDTVDLIMKLTRNRMRGLLDLEYFFLEELEICKSLMIDGLEILESANRGYHGNGENIPYGVFLAKSFPKHWKLPTEMTMNLTTRDTVSSIYHKSDNPIVDSLKDKFKEDDVNAIKEFLRTQIDDFDKKLANSHPALESNYQLLAHRLRDFCNYYDIEYTRAIESFFKGPESFREY